MLSDIKNGVARFADGTTITLPDVITARVTPDPTGRKRRRFDLDTAGPDGRTFGRNVWAGDPRETVEKAIAFLTAAAAGQKG